MCEINHKLSLKAMYYWTYIRNLYFKPNRQHFFSVYCYQAAQTITPPMAKTITHNNRRVTNDLPYHQLR